MAADLEEQKKAILPFMQRAQEIQQADPKVAYYCRLYGVEQALKFPQRAKEINSLIGAVLSQLEKDKAKLDLDAANDRIHCLGFALRIFDRADRTDRAGKANETTSKAYYAASVFIEILNHFDGCVDAELIEKQRYCAWRAAEIRKAVREGRTPLPPPAEEPPAPEAGAPAGANQPDDLPPASGSSDWAYGGSGSSNARFQQPTPGSFSGGSFSGAGAASGASIAGAQVATAVPPQPYVQPLYPQGQPVAGMPPLYPQEQPGVPAPGPLATAARGMDGAAGGAARFWPGAKMLVRADEGLEDGLSTGSGEAQEGTVGQVIRRPDGGISYKVALRDRLVEVPDEAAVPALQEDGLASLYTQRLPPGALSAAGGLAALPLVPVRVLLINSASWPPSYLVQTPDGKELEASAPQLGPPTRPEGAPAAPAAAPPPPQPDHAIGPDYGNSHAASTAAPPQPPMYPHPAAAMPPPPSSSSPYPSASSQAAPPSHPYGAAALPPPPASQPYGAPTAPPPPSQPYAKSYSSPSPASASAGAWAAGSVPPAAAAAPPAAIPMPSPGYKPPLQVITEAQKQAKYAVSALSFEDIPTAVKNLTEAIRLLTDPAAAASHIRR